MTYRTLYALYLPLGVCVYFEVNSTLTAYPHRTLHPRPHNRNSFSEFLSIANFPTSVRERQGHSTTVFCKYLFGEADIT